MRPPQPPRRPNRTPAQQQPELPPAPPAPPPDPEPPPPPEPPEPEEPDEQDEPEPAPEPEPQPQPEQPPHTPGNPAHRRFKTGAKPTPPDRRDAAPKFSPGARAAAVTQKAWVPQRLSPWGNFDHGCCVTTEEAFAKACHSPTLFASEQEVIDWARRHDALEGAYLPEVMDQMAREGLVIAGSGDRAPWKDGPARTVDFRNEAVLQAAVAAGPVKLGIMSSALPADAGNKPGWHAAGPGPRGRQDHCVSLAGFGPAAYLYQQLGVPLPGGLDGQKPGYLLFTWSTIGFVDYAWVRAACGEAWLREPTTVEHAPAPSPTPTPTPAPTPPPPEGRTITVPADLPAGTYTLTPTEAAPAGAVTIPPALLAALRALLCAAREAGHDAE